MAKILIQTTIPYSEDDWHAGRFSLLTRLLAEEHEVDARNKEGGVDPVLAALDRLDYDQLWLFAVDSGNGLSAEECRAISEFRRHGGGLFVTRDHMDLGSSICNLGGVGPAHYFHSQNPDPDERNRKRDDTGTPAIDWPNYHSGANGDVQTIDIVGPVHPLLTRPDGSTLKYFPAHPHEGAVGAPAGDATARVIARGHSQMTHRPFNIAVAFDAAGEEGNALAESTFHHFCDYNWDVSMGCPSFVGEAPSNKIAQKPALLDDVKQYCRNLSHWLSKTPQIGRPDLQAADRSN